MIRAALPSSAARSWLECWSTRTIVPGVWSSPATVSCSCRSSTRRSVMMTTLSKIGWSSSPCSRDSEWAVQAMVLDLPEPAECWTSRSTPAPSALVAATMDRTACHWWNRGNSDGAVLDVHERGQQVEPGVALPDLLPQVRGLVAVGRRVARAARLPGPAEPLLNGRNRVCSPASRVVIATRCGSTAKCTTVRLARIRSCGLRSRAVLLHRVLDGLPGQRVLQLRGGDRDAVDHQHQVERVGRVRLGVVQLPDHAAAVGLVALLQLRGQGVGRPEPSTSAP